MHKTFKLTAAQGEITLRKVEHAAGSGFSPLAAENGLIIVGHSETGHHHVMDATKVTALMMDRPPEGLRILRLIVSEPTRLDHLRGHDTHDALIVPVGEYEARIGREYDPYQQLARRVAD